MRMISAILHHACIIALAVSDGSTLPPFSDDPGRYDEGLLPGPRPAPLPIHISGRAWQHRCGEGASFEVQVRAELITCYPTGEF